MSSSPTPSERFDEIEALLRPQEGDRGPGCVEFRRELADRLPLDGLSPKQQDHAASCESCAEFASSWQATPKLLGDALSNEGIASSPLPAGFESLPWLQEPELLAKRTLVPSNLEQQVEAALSKHGSTKGDKAEQEALGLLAPSELDTRVEALTRSAVGREPAPVLSFSWRATAAAAVLLLSTVLVWQQQKASEIEIEVVLVEKPFDLRFDSNASPRPGTTPDSGQGFERGHRNGEEEDE